MSCASCCHEGLRGHSLIIRFLQMMSDGAGHGHEAGEEREGTHAKRVNVYLTGVQSDSLSSWTPCR